MEQRKEGEEVLREEEYGNVWLAVIVNSVESIWARQIIAYTWYVPRFRNRPSRFIVLVVDNAIQKYPFTSLISSNPTTFFSYSYSPARLQSTLLSFRAITN